MEGSNCSALPTKLGLTIHVSHFPPGTSKWNKIEHRLFSFITMNWRGRPLRTYETIVNAPDRQHDKQRRPRRKGDPRSSPLPDRQKSDSEGAAGDQHREARKLPRRLELLDSTPRDRRVNAHVAHSRALRHVRAVAPALAPVVAAPGSSATTGTAFPALPMACSATPIRLVAARLRGRFASEVSRRADPRAPSRTGWRAPVPRVHPTRIARTFRNVLLLRRAVLLPGRRLLRGKANQAAGSAWQHRCGRCLLTCIDGQCQLDRRMKLRMGRCACRVFLPQPRGVSGRPR